MGFGALTSRTNVIILAPADWPYGIMQDYLHDSLEDYTVCKLTSQNWLLVEHLAGKVGAISLFTRHR